MHFTLCMFLSWLQTGKQKLTKERLFRSIQYKQISLFFLFLFFFGWTTWLAESYPQPGIKPVPLAVEAWSLNYWTIKEVPKTDLSFLVLHEALEISDFPRILQSWHLFALFSDKPLRQRDLQKIMGEVSVASSEIFYFPNYLLVSIWATQRTWDLESILPTLIFINLALILPTSKDSYNRDNLCEQSGT